MTNREYYLNEMLHYWWTRDFDNCEITRYYRLHSSETRHITTIQKCRILETRAFGGETCWECRELNKKWLDSSRGDEE